MILTIYSTNMSDGFERKKLGAYLPLQIYDIIIYIFIENSIENDKIEELLDKKESDK